MRHDIRVKKNIFYALSFRIKCINLYRVQEYVRTCRCPSVEPCGAPRLVEKTLVAGLKILRGRMVHSVARICGVRGPSVWTSFITAIRIRNLLLMENGVFGTGNIFLVCANFVAGKRFIDITICGG